MLETNIDSFILRFVHEQDPEGDRQSRSWHGVIRHVQTNQQITFANIEEAMTFVADFIEFDDLAGISQP